MGTLISIYVRVSSTSMASALQKTYPTAYTEAGSQFYGIDRPRGSFTCPDGELQALSKQLHTDVIWLSFQSAVDAFHYRRWSMGEHIRTLVYGCWKQERIWEEVTGNVEAWERTVLFDPAELASQLKHLDSAEQRHHLERVYQTQSLVVGEPDPGLEAREAARGVATFFNLPGWR